MEDFPLLDYVPTFLSPWKRHAKALHQFELELYSKLTAGVRRKMKAGELPECLMRHLLENQKVRTAKSVLVAPLAELRADFFNPFFPPIDVRLR